MYSLTQGDVQKIREKLASGFPPADRKLLEVPENIGMMIEEITEGYRQGWAGPARDDIVINSPWGFHLRDISVRIDIWHGELDENVPVNQGRYQHERIPHSRLTVLPGQAHLCLLAKWREVLAALVE
jgi:pimeloyl-ACP methyl ester carboxylesterase